jgi:multiple sugar transport system permease protein
MSRALAGEDRAKARARRADRTGIARDLRGLRRRLEPYLLVGPAVVVLTLFFVWPVIYNLLLSFQSVSIFELGRGGRFVGLQNYADLLRDRLTLLSVQNTVFWLTLVTVASRLILGVGLALLLNATVLRRWRLSGLARTLLLIPWITPPVVAVAAWRWLLDGRYGAINQLLVQLGLIREGIPFLAQTSTVWPAIDVMIVWRDLPFVVVSVLAGLQSIQRELYEAARVDGASESRLLIHITLPQLRPVLTVVALLTTIWTFNNFVYVWLATGGGPGDFTQVLATRVFITAFTDYRLGAAAAIGVFMSLIMLVFAIVYFALVFRQPAER